MHFFKGNIAFLVILLALPFAVRLYAGEIKKPRLFHTINVANAYVDGGYVMNPDPVVSSTISLNWYGMYLRHWEMWDLSDYNSPERSARYDNNRQYRIESCNYVAGYTHSLNDFDIPLRISFQAKYSQYPHRRIRTKRSDGSIRYRHTKGNQLAMFLRSDNLLPDWTKAKYFATLEIDYQPLSYYWLFKLHTDFHYPITDKVRVGVNQSLYTKPSRAHVASTGHTGFAATALTTTPYIRYQIRENVYVRFYVGLAAALEQYTRDNWRRNKLNNRRNHWCGASLTWDL